MNKQPIKFIDKVLLNLAPKALLTHIKYREKARHALSYEGANPGRLRAKAYLSQEASSEDPNTQRERIDMVWESRQLEKNFPFVSKILGLFEDYVLGDFTILSEVDDLNDRMAINMYWEQWQLIADYSGKDNFHDLSRLALRSMVRDGDIVAQMHVGEVIPLGTETLPVLAQTAVSLQLIEGDRVGSPYEFGFGNGYLNGIVYDQVNGEPLAYRVFQRDPISNSYTNPVDLPAGSVIHLRQLKRADAYRGVTEFAPALPTMRDIIEIIENERIAVKWASSNAGIVKKVSGQAGDDTTDYDDAFAPTSPAGAKRPTEQWQPGQVQYLFPDEEFKSFEYNRASPAFQGLLDILYRDCCLAVNLPYGFVINPNGNGTAARLESAQARRTFKRWQTVMRDRWIMPIWIRCMLHAISTGQLRISTKSIEQLTRIKINWPAHPTADVGRESAANIAEYEAGLKSASTIFAERGEDYQVEMRQIAHERLILDDLNGVGASISKNFGPGAMQAFTQLVQTIGTSISADQAKVLMMGVYGLPEEMANKFLNAKPLVKELPAKAN